MKLNSHEIMKKEEWLNKGYQVLSYDRDKLIQDTHKAPAWIHFGAGNIFRAFPAAVLNRILNQQRYDKGVIVCESFDYEIIDQAYLPCDNLSLLVLLKADGSISKELIGSVTEAIKADSEYQTDWSRLNEIFMVPSLQMVSFTITEKGYSLNAPDATLSRTVSEDLSAGGLEPKHLMGKLAALLYKRYQIGQYPIAMVSMDNCSHNGDKLKAGVLYYAKAWVEKGLVPVGFLDYLNSPDKVSFPLSMIDKITPRPDSKVKEMLEKDGFEDARLILTDKNTYTAPYVNAEETEYLVIENVFPNGRPPLELGGILFTDRETVDKVEKMKVCTCLNPLHTALAIYGCLLGYTAIWEEMKDEQLSVLIERMGKEEGMPVVVDPGIIRPEDFIHEVLYKRLPNPFMPDSPQRIATDTSQKLPIRYGETLKAYIEGNKEVKALKYIPFVIAGYLRYLLGVDDWGRQMELSSDPLLEELMAGMSQFKLGNNGASAEELRFILGRSDIFPVDLYQAGLADKIAEYFNQLAASEGAVRKTLCEVIG